MDQSQVSLRHLEPSRIKLPQDLTRNMVHLISLHSTSLPLMALLALLALLAPGLMNRPRDRQARPRALAIDSPLGHCHQSWMTFTESIHSVSRVEIRDFFREGEEARSSCLRSC